MFSGGKAVAEPFRQNMTLVPAGVLLSFRSRLAKCFGVDNPTEFATARNRRPTVVFIQREGVRSWTNLEEAMEQLKTRFKE